MYIHDISMVFIVYKDGVIKEVTARVLEMLGTNTEKSRALFKLSVLFSVCYFSFHSNWLQDKTIYCPVSGKPLKVKDLVDVTFTLMDGSIPTSSLEGKRERYKCPVTGDVLRNNVPCAVLKTTYVLYIYMYQ